MIRNRKYRKRMSHKWSNRSASTPNFPSSHTLLPYNHSCLADKRSRARPEPFTNALSGTHVRFWANRSKENRTPNSDEERTYWPHNHGWGHKSEDRPDSPSALWSDVSLYKHCPIGTLFFKALLAGFLSDNGSNHMHLRTDLPGLVWSYLSHYMVTSLTLAIYWLVSFR